MEVNKFVLLGAGITLVIAIAGRNPIRNGVEAVTNTSDFEKWDYLLKKHARSYGVSWRYLKYIILNESSNGNAKSVLRGLAVPSDVEGSKSSDGKSWGLMQITLPTAKALAGRSVSAVELNNPDFNVALSAKLMKELVLRYGVNNREKIFRDYNGGPKMGPMTLAYWAKTLANREIVLKKQPGNELEF